MQGEAWYQVTVLSEEIQDPFRQYPVPNSTFHQLLHILYNRRWKMIQQKEVSSVLTLDFIPLSSS